MNHPPMIQRKGIKNPRMKHIEGTGDCRRVGRKGKGAISESAERGAGATSIWYDFHSVGRERYWVSKTRGHCETRMDWTGTGGRGRFAKRSEDSRKATVS